MSFTLTARRTKTNIAPFIATLVILLKAEDTSIIRWSDDGRYVQILDQARLAKHVLPKYFRHGKYASFQRQLNYFGFRKQNGCRTTLSNYYHKHFSRDRICDWKLIQRKGTEIVLDHQQLHHPYSADSWTLDSTTYPISDPTPMKMQILSTSACGPMLELEIPHPLPFTLSPPHHDTIEWSILQELILL